VRIRRRQGGFEARMQSFTSDDAWEEQVSTKDDSKTRPNTNPGEKNAWKPFLLGGGGVGGEEPSIKKLRELIGSEPQKPN